MITTYTKKQDKNHQSTTVGVRISENDFNASSINNLLDAHNEVEGTEDDSTRHV